jgi:hypothetical protein
LLRPFSRDIAFLVHRIKAVVALVLALVWWPAVSCCLIDGSGLLAKKDCCPKEHSQTVPGPSHCDQPCGTLAAAHYFPQQSQLLLLAPVGATLVDCAKFLLEIQNPSEVGRDLRATAPPELAGHWQFSFRTALSPRAPSFAS